MSEVDTRTQKARGNEEFTDAILDSWKNISMLPEPHRFETTEFYIRFLSINETLEDKYLARWIDDNELGNLLDHEGLGDLFPGAFIPRALYPVLHTLRSGFDLIGWSEAGIFMEWETNLSEEDTDCHVRVTRFFTWARFYDYVMGHIEDSDMDTNLLVDCKYLCNKIKLFLEEHPELPQIKQKLIEKAA